jgi:hypothetical protein
MSLVNDHSIYTLFCDVTLSNDIIYYRLDNNIKIHARNIPHTIIDKQLLDILLRKKCWIKTINISLPLYKEMLSMFLRK